ncbi:exostosin-like 3 [Diadema antillarum]|uniref:exostosin-like 3 n=1 Tax=Diadema antillarum TaxID=105358 RepID=UPI003A8C876C
MYNEPHPLWGTGQRMEYQSKKELLPPRTASNPSFAAWLQRSGHLTRLIIILFVILIVLPFVTHHYLSNSDLDVQDQRSLDMSVDEMVALKPSELKAHIVELYRIKSSVQAELRQLEERRKLLQAQVTRLSLQLDHAQSEVHSAIAERDRLKDQIQQTIRDQSEIVERSLRHISAPFQILPNIEDSGDIEPPNSAGRCRQHTCFDYSRCSLTSRFPVYVYHPEDLWQDSNKLDATIKLTVTNAFGRSTYLTRDANMACIYVVLVGDLEDQGRTTSSLDLETRLHKLPYWRHDGRNHLLLHLVRSLSTHNILQNVNTGRAIVVQTPFTDLQFRQGFDIIAPMLLGLSSETNWKDVPLQFPARRKYLITYQGSKPTQTMLQKEYVDDRDTAPLSRRLKDVDRTKSVEDILIQELDKLKSLTDDNVHLDFACKSFKAVDGFDASDWKLCSNKLERLKLLKQSTYALLLSPGDHVVSSTTFYTRLFEALQTGAIPIIVGEHMQLPFSEFISWKEAAIVLPRSRVTELYFYLKTIQDNDILKLRRQGWFLWTTYLSNTDSVINGILATLRTRLGIPANVAPEEKAREIFSEEYPQKTQRAEQMYPESDDVFPAPELPFSSPKFLRNFTSIAMDSYFTWNNPPGAQYLYPYTPFDPVVPSDAKFLGSTLGFRPIGGGAGGSGKEFQESLGGNVPREQFTVVMLTYEREAVLMNSLQRLMGLPFLNKVLVVWNAPAAPSPDLVWPEIHVPIKVVRTSANSLNNRFLPYDEIETEAILSLDDDAHLRHDEILFGFRVWRESRDRVVGFPGRYHAWDLNYRNGFLYSANYSCELSMVLTGAAFIHKYYMYLYSYMMPQPIRDKVDEYMNCEDIAMNFLVSHVTRKPPIKVTSRWTFRCAGCPEALSMDDSHFQERHKCIQYFTKVYGYTPLLYTQYRVDSVLFKTRIPHDKQKCFKFI